MFRLDLKPIALEAWPKGPSRALGWLKGKRVAALSGLGRPGRFEAALRDLGAQVSPWRFPDHHRFRLEELRHPPTGAAVIVSTFKDRARLPAAWAPALPVYALRVEAQVTPGPAFQRLLGQALRRA